MSSRFEAEEVLTSLVGRPPEEGDVLARDGEFWRFDKALGPTVEHGEVLMDLEIDVAQGAVHHIILGSNISILKPKNLRRGRTYFFFVQQDEQGSRLITWDSVFKWPSGNAPTLSTAANALDDITFGCVELNGALELHGVYQYDMR